MRNPTILESFLPLWAASAVMLGLLIGYYLGPLDWLSPVITVFLILILYPMMINLKIEALAGSLRNARLLLAAAVLNFIMSPLLGAILAHWIFKGSDPFIAMGFILVTIVPCGATTASWTGYSRGSVESALVIIGSSVILSVVMVPLWIYVWASLYIRVDLVLVLERVVLVLVIPLVVGQLTRSLLIRKYGLGGYQRIVPFLPAVSLCATLATLVCMMALSSQMLLSSLHTFPLVLLGLVAMYFILFTSGLFISRLTGLNYESAIALCYGVTSRNMPLSVAIAAVAFPGTLAILPPSLGPLFQIPTMMTLVWFSRRFEMWLERPTQE